MTKSKANAAIPNDDAAATPPTLPEAAEPTPFRPGSKLAALVARLVATGGATLEELMDATGWQAHSVRGALAGALRKRAGDINAARLHLEAHLGEASLVVLSGGITDEGQSRLHLYWRLTEVVSGPQLMQLCDLRGILARKVGGDTSFDSPHQPIRLLGRSMANPAIGGWSRSQIPQIRSMNLRKSTAQCNKCRPLTVCWRQHLSSRHARRGRRPPN